MELQTWSPDEAGRLSDLYNEQIEGIPYRYPVTADEFATGIREWRYADRDHVDFRAERLIVAVDDGEPLGFVDVGLIPPRSDRETDDVGEIRFLVYRPGDRRVGQALLDAAEAHCQSEGAGRMEAFWGHCIYKFYYHEHGVTDLLGHLRGLFRTNDYDAMGGEIFLAWDDYAVSEPAMLTDDIDLVRKKHHGKGRLPGMRLQAVKDGDGIGTCVAHCVGDFQPHEDAQERLFVEWLGIQDDSQGKGWGWFLLQRMLWEMHQEGYRHATISTDVANHRGLLFYTNFGFRVVDTSYEFRKEMRDERSEIRDQG